MIKADYLIIAAVLLFFSCHAITHYLIYQFNTIAEQIGEAKEIVLQFETNPATRWILASENIAVIYTTIVMPGMIGGLYYFTRRHLLSRGDELTLTSTAVMIVVMAFSNFLNDFSVLLGVLL